MDVPREFLLSGERLVQSRVRRIPFGEEAWEAAGGFALGEEWVWVWVNSVS